MAWLTSDQLKSEIGQTREQLSETADALAYRRTFRPRRQDWIEEKKDAVVSTVSGVSSKAGEITPDGAEVSNSMNRMKRLAERNPVGLAIGGASVGFIAGLLMPSTRTEKTSGSARCRRQKATAADADGKLSSAGKDVGRKPARPPSRRRRNVVARRRGAVREPAGKPRDVAPTEASTPGGTHDPGGSIESPPSSRRHLSPTRRCNGSAGADGRSLRRDVHVPELHLPVLQLP